MSVSYPMRSQATPGPYQLSEQIGDTQIRLSVRIAGLTRFAAWQALAIQRVVLS